jgi:nucleotide-binding universal stress UspA family protein
MFHHILLAWDGSPSAERAVDVVIDLARRYDADVTAASVAYAPAHAETTADRRESVDGARRHLEDSFARIHDRAERAGVMLDQHILESDDPASALLAYAHDHAFDLVVVGHHARGRGGRVLFGGLSDRLTENPRVPVLVIGNGADDSDHA